MRFEKKQIADDLATGSGTEFDCSTWGSKSVQVIGTGTVDIEGTIDGATWHKLGATLMSPSLVVVAETVLRVRATRVSGTIDVWLAGLNSQTE